MSSTALGRLRPVALIAASAASVAALDLLGRGPLKGPPTGSVAEVMTWATAGDPIVVGLTLFRLAAMVVAAHLTVTSILAVAGRMLRRPGIVQIADAWTLPPFRTALRRAAGLSISAAAVLSSPIPGAQASTPVSALAEPGSATMRAVGGTVNVLVPTTAPGSGTATLRVVTADSGDGTATVTVTARGEGPDPAAAPAPEPSPDPDRPDRGGRHVVRPGDHLWQIASDTLASTLGRPPTDAEVAPYWRRVVRANPQLGDPDLLLPGDEVVVPPP